MARYGREVDLRIIGGGVILRDSVGILLPIALQAPPRDRNGIKPAETPSRRAFYLAVPSRTAGCCVEGAGGIDPKSPPRDEILRPPGRGNGPSAGTLAAWSRERSSIERYMVARYDSGNPYSRS
jgi:hypothetical protein